MKLPASRPAIGALLVSLVIQAMIVVYTDVRDVLYDEQGINGLIFWVGALWIVPIVGLLTLFVSVVRNRAHRREVGKRK